MVDWRTATAAVGLVGSVLVSVLLWWYFETLLVFLLVPFVPFLFRGGDDWESRELRECPQCGYRTTERSFTFCPRDGTRLE